MNSIILTDTEGNTYKAIVLFTHYDYTFGKNYIVYSIDDDILASSYEKVEDKYIINNDLTSNEYDMIDKEISMKMGELNA